MRTVNNDTINLIKEFEASGVPNLVAYHDSIDPKDVDTIGFGTIKYPPNYLGGKAVRVGDAKITPQQAVDFLTWEVNLKAAAVEKLVKSKITDNQFGALVSFAYNLGEGALSSSTLLKKVNANPNDSSIRDEFNKWINASGHPQNGLIRRRKAEADLYFKN